MFNKKILSYLMNLTEEEQQILTGQSLINKDLYTEKKDFEIDAKKLLHNDELINIRKHTRFIDFPEHKHNYIEMAYILQGEMIQKIKGKEIRLKKGEIIFLNQHITHEIKASSKEDIIINFIIKPEFFEYILNLIDKENIISKFLFSTIYGGSRKGEYICFYVGNIKNVQNIIEQVINEIINMSTLGKSKIKFLVGLLLIELLNNPQSIVSYSEENYDIKLMMEILKYIDESYEEANLTKLCETLHQQDYKICKLIKKNTGLTFKELVQEKRIEKAIELLKSTDYAIEDIIRRVGYENDSYFYRIFKKKFGLSPKEYKKNIINK
ncbi:MAG: helix-turn-helix domain-containing protein [Fusobacteriaceae bacterium]|nr:helix-turn-helix domain-containing protein [Fusobacteriaceae bacterium]